SAVGFTELVSSFVFFFWSWKYEFAMINTFHLCDTQGFDVILRTMLCIQSMGDKERASNKWHFFSVKSNSLNTFESPTCSRWKAKPKPGCSPATARWLSRSLSSLAAHCLLT